MTAPRARLRALCNMANLSTPLGLLVAAAARTALVPGPEGLLLGFGYRFPLPKAGAFTVGNVVLFRAGADDVAARPRLVAHESRHATQYALCLGLPFLPLYAVAAAWSMLRTGHPALCNPFEVRAGLADGGYRPRLKRSPRPRSPLLPELTAHARCVRAKPVHSAGWRRRTPSPWR